MICLEIIRWCNYRVTKLRETGWKGTLIKHWILTWDQRAQTNDVIPSDQKIHPCVLLEFLDQLCILLFHLADWFTYISYQWITLYPDMRQNGLIHNYRRYVMSFSFSWTWIHDASLEVTCSCLVGMKSCSHMGQFGHLWLTVIDDDM